ncbi:MAG: aldehyde ferredoxin oxidoreductase N-terminal domain-containing protein [Candidatus Nanoarchaeia archaeon]
MKQKALFINLDKKIGRVEDIEGFGPVDFAVNNYEKEFFMFGMGPLAGSIVPGTHRLIFVNKSPLWEGIVTSTAGGAAHPMYSLGVNYVAISGKGKKYQILKLKNQQVEFYDIEEEDLEKIFKKYKNKKGAHALQEYVFDKYAKDYINDNAQFRILVVGPAALKTNYGAIVSTVIDKNHFREGVDSWAGRGGFGSLLAQKHKVVAIIYGGNYENDARLKDLQKINKIFQEEFKEVMAKAIMNAGKKYYYDDTLKSGGTFGSNFTTLKEWFLSFNWNSVYYTDSQRQEMYKTLIQEHYLKQFNEEIIQPKNFTTCGETCPIMCKKWDKKYKKDYEPYEANGPNSGIFDQRAAELLVHRIDELGYDAIEGGNMISWIMDLIDQDVINPENYGLQGKPRFRYENFDVVNDSKHNAEYAIQIAEMILTEKGKIFQKGIREASRKLGKKAMNLALYTPNCENGSIAPCQYWVPAFFLPIPIQGKFLSDYEIGFKTPYELGKSSADRIIKELYSENTGICRFHRKWSEKLIEKMVNSLMGLNMNYYEHHRKLVQRIRNLNNLCKQPQMWESEKVIDVIQMYYEKLYRADQQNKELEEWVNKFRKDKWKAAEEYWKEVIRGVNEVIDKNNKNIN